MITVFGEKVTLTSCRIAEQWIYETFPKIEKALYELYVKSSNAKLAPLSSSFYSLRAATWTVQNSNEFPT